MKGLYYDLSYETYDAIDAVRWTTLKNMDVSEAHYRWCLRHPREDTPALDLGRKVHVALLEPASFKARYALWEGPGTRATNAYKAFAAEAEQSGYEGVVLPEEWADILAMAAAVRRDPYTRKYTRSGRSEVTIVWTDKVTGLRCKARIDRLSRTTATNFKTAKTVDPWWFGRQAWDLLYPANLAFTLGGLATLGMNRAGKLVVVDKSDEHQCAVFDVDGDELAAGEAVVSRLMAKLAECKKSRRWSGRFIGEQKLMLPQRAYAEDTDLSSLGIAFSERASS